MEKGRYMEPPWRKSLSFKKKKKNKLLKILSKLKKSKKMQ